MKKNKEEQKAKAKEIAKLKKEGTKAAWTHKKIESQLKTKSDALQRTMADNKKLKQELKRVSKEREDAIKLNTKYRKRISGTPSVSSSGSVGSSTSSVASHSITGGGGERKPDSKRRRSSAVAKKTKSMLEGEVSCCGCGRLLISSIRLPESCFTIPLRRIWKHLLLSVILI